MPNTFHSLDESSHGTTAPTDNLSVSDGVPASELRSDQEHAGKSAQDALDNTDKPAALAETGWNRSPTESAFEMVPTSSLIPHPLHEALYGKTSNPALRRSIEAHGILVPLLITPENLLISGKSRWDCALELNIPEVPVRTVPVTDKIEVEELILEANRNRKKNTEQTLREYEAYVRIEKEKAKRRSGQRNDLRTDSSTGQHGRARELAAEKVEIGATTAEQGLKVLKAIAEHTSHHPEKAEELRKLLNDTSINAAFEKAKEWDWITRAASKAGQKAPPENPVIGKQCETEKSAENITPSEVGRSDKEAGGPVLVREDREEIPPDSPPKESVETPLPHSISSDSGSSSSPGFISEQELDKRVKPSGNPIIAMHEYAYVLKEFISLANRLAGNNPAEGVLIAIEQAGREISTLARLAKEESRTSNFSPTATLDVR